MNKNDIFLLESHGWIVVCESPFEIEHNETCSLATGEGAKIILNSLKLKPVKNVGVGELFNSISNHVKDEFISNSPRLELSSLIMGFSNDEQYCYLTEETSYNVFNRFKISVTNITNPNK